MGHDTVDLRRAIRDIPDFPKPGIVFKDITPLLGDGALFQRAVDLLSGRYKSEKVDVVLGIESRGFIIGAAIAYRLGAGFCIVRKPGKLPYETHSASYELEYGSDKLELHRDAFRPGARVLVVDDLIATGGTAVATVDLVKKLQGSVVGCAFLIELVPLKGRDRLKPHGVFSLIPYDSA
jgi:adenine phosphoribosyltransferase